ncbi:HD domain-containing protein, partial [uncultured Clostridium sp.]
MKNIDIIFNNVQYRNALKSLKEYEKDREFCNHTIEHFIDVARIAYIMVLEENLNISKEVIYAIGLLHDIGRVKQYEEGISHDIASVEMSKEILKETNFT